MRIVIRPAALFAAVALCAWPAIGNAQNLISNPSFEDPPIGLLPAGCGSSSNWFYCPSAQVPGWTVEWVQPNSDGLSGFGNLEYQTAATLPGTGNDPTDGVQYIELDTAPGGASNDRRVRISQTVSLSACPLDRYTLTYDHAQRQGAGAGIDEDILEVQVNDIVVVPSGPSPTTSFQSYSVPIVPTGSSVKVSFAEIGRGSTLGSLLDNVSLTNDFATSACPELDAKPMSYPNGANLCQGNGVVPVAFVGNQYFDPYDWTIVGVSLVTDPGAGDFIAGKGKSEACHIEDVVDGTNPDGYAPDGYADVVCHIPAMDLGDNVDTTGATPAVANVCLTINDGIGGPNITICASDELKLARTCE